MGHRQEILLGEIVAGVETAVIEGAVVVEVVTEILIIIETGGVEVVRLL